MPVIDNTTLPTGIGISESQYKEFMREIKAMKPNKRKNWKNYLVSPRRLRIMNTYLNSAIVTISTIGSSIFIRENII